MPRLTRAGSAGTRRRVAPHHVDSRFSEPPAREMVEYVSARRMRETGYSFPHEMWNHQAHTLMLHERGILRRSDAAKILRVLAEITRKGPDRFPIDPGKGELLFSVETYLTARIGEESASRMHTGRSRGDLYVCVERMVFREKLLQVVDVLTRLTDTMLQLAAKHVETVMPGYTLLQHAQPTTFAHYLLSFVDRFRRDLDRLREAYGRVNQSPMGSAILSGTGFPVDRRRMAALLGFSAVIENTRDASTSRDHSLETITHAAILSSNLMALAEDLILWCTYEFGMVELADGYSGTSSIMPQKKNPSALTRVRHLAAESVGNTMTVFAQLKTHSEELNDFEATGPIIWRALDTVVASLELMRGLLATLTVKRHAMSVLAGANFIQAAQLAESVAKAENLGFRTAHKIVGRLVRICVERRIAPADIRPELLHRASIEVTGRPLRMSLQRVRQAMDVDFILRHRETLGGPGRQQVLGMLKRRVSLLAKDRAWLSAQRGSLAQARRMVDSLSKRVMR
ncbi:MAG TPA: argininosuccinate lyase [Candidatus Methylomirabilis sp.]|nr:argininosuccinate lyase [Candidatus Methylomirabilis sp.]HSC69858.1 argininosuccinate lyase [Candidatus Methylomirabilis sp.]